MVGLQPGAEVGLWEALEVGTKHLPLNFEGFPLLCHLFVFPSVFWWRAAKVAVAVLRQFKL